MKIAVTGATGTLGKAIMFRLREAGNSVVGIGMNQAKISAMEEQNFVMKRCDITKLEDLDAVVKAHGNGEFDLPNDSYILMGHSLGAFIALLYEGIKPTDKLEERCEFLPKKLQIY